MAVFYIFSGRKEGRAIHQWLINVYPTREEAERRAATRNDVWVSECRDWLVEELSVGRRTLFETTDELGAANE